MFSDIRLRNLAIARLIHARCPDLCRFCSVFAEIAAHFVPRKQLAMQYDVNGEKKQAVTPACLTYVSWL